MARLIEGKKLEADYFIVTLDQIIRFYEENALGNSKLDKNDIMKWHYEAIDPVRDRVVFRRYIQK